jgi:tetratricopeptide (TPR) repeat protein
MNESAFTAAVSAVEADPSSEDGWSELEGLADKLNRPDEVAAAYRAALERGLARDVAPKVADRAVKFCQEWFIDTPEALPQLLEGIVEKYPEMDWAFERLVVTLTSNAQWSELLAMYDKKLAVTRDEKKRSRLLDDAANLAKDFANQPDKAVDYMQQLLTLDPSNASHSCRRKRHAPRAPRSPRCRSSVWGNRKLR